MEILAPAGAMEQVEAAVRSGADAVYIGTKNFNARRNAQNFDEAQLNTAVSYCHARNVKVYVTLNTLIKDTEIDSAKAEIIKAATAGADALIVQDMAMFYLVKSMVPSMHIHASTQMSVHNVSGAKMLESLGFSRVVPARELSLAELKAIRENTSLELEVFIHGALCMCISGQCYLSSVLGQRSANRGMCAQPCRLDFRSRNGGHALSLKDLSAIDCIKELEKAGITSAKIEGRMKRPEYVAAATSACRQALNGAEYDKVQLQSVFSRSGFTNAYIEGKPGRDMFGYRTKEDVVSAAPVLRRIASQYRKEIPLAGVKMLLEIKAGMPVTLTVCDGINEVTVNGNAPQAAINREVSDEFAKSALIKCGGTPFFCESCEFSIDPGLSVAMSELNSLRKSALESLLETRSALQPKAVNDVSLDIASIVFSESRQVFARFESESQICDKADRIILDFEILYNSPELCRRLANKLIIELPSVMFSESRVASKLSELKDRGLNAIYAPNLYAVQLGVELGFEIIGGFGLNIMNSVALDQYRKIGLTMAEISFECTLERFDMLRKSIPCGLVVYGKMPLMTFRTCPVKGENGCLGCDGRQKLIDRRGTEITVLCKDKKFTRLLNPQPIYMLDKADQLTNAAFVTLYFTDESNSECAEIINRVASGRPSDKPFTRGLYYKEIL